MWDCHDSFFLTSSQNYRHLMHVLYSLCIVRLWLKRLRNNTWNVGVAIEFIWFVPFDNYQHQHINIYWMNNSHPSIQPVFLFIFFLFSPLFNSGFLFFLLFLRAILHIIQRHNKSLFYSVFFPDSIKKVFLFTPKVLTAASCPRKPHFDFRLLFLFLFFFLIENENGRRKNR